MSTAVEYSYCKVYTIIITSQLKFVLRNLRVKDTFGQPFTSKEIVLFLDFEIN